MEQQAEAGCVIVIPARFASTRLPGKPLLNESGKFLIQHVYERAVRVPSARRVLIATDDERIRDAAASFGAEAVMTRADCVTGTDRVAEAVRGIDRCPIVVNLQGDEPEMDPEVVEKTVRALLDSPDAGMATPVSGVRDPRDLERSQVVKVVVDAHGRALYFSRAPIPFARNGGGAACPALRHVGLYVYRREFLERFVQLPPGRLEKTEQLEQLRALESGYNIQTALVEYEGINIDTPDDYRRFLRRLEAGVS